MHGEETFRKAVLEAKKSGLPDARIGEIFGITFRQLERIITETYGVNISTLGRPWRITSWEPKDFRKETTTVWSYPQRGDWATHHGGYRGNWSPYIPLNVILKYSKTGDLVLDYFVGGGGRQRLRPSSFGVGVLQGNPEIPKSPWLISFSQSQIE